MISLKNVSFGYDKNSLALKNVSLDIEDGRVYCILGRTGSGKSTLVRHFNGLLTPKSGTVLLDGEDIKKMNKKLVRSKVGLVFQYPEQQLFADTVFEDIAFGPRNIGLSENEVKIRVTAAMEAVSLSEEIGKKSPFNLSGGEKRRAALAGVIAMQPQVLVLDEPSAGLDPGSRRELYAMIKRLKCEKNENTIVFVSHSMDEAANMADYVFVMNNGMVRMSGAPQEVFNRTEDLYSCGLGLPKAAELAMLLGEL